MTEQSQKNTFQKYADFAKNGPNGTTHFFHSNPNIEQTSSRWRVLFSENLVQVLGMLPAKYGVKPECFVDTETCLVKNIFFWTRGVPLAQRGPIFSIFSPFKVAQKQGKLKSIELLLQKCYQGCQKALVKISGQNSDLRGGAPPPPQVHTRSYRCYIQRSIGP